MDLLEDVLTGACVVEPVDYDFGTPTTKGAVRIRGRDWSVFVKVIQAFRHWPALGLLPEAMQRHVLDSPLWRYEADLAQLLIGLAHAGQLPVSELPRIRETIINGYREGLAEEGFAADRREVACGLDGALAVRSAFTAVPLDRLGEPSSDDLLRNRLELTRYLCDLGLALDE